MGFNIRVGKASADLFDLFGFVDEYDEPHIRRPDGTVTDEFWAVIVNDSSDLFDFPISDFRSFQRVTDSSD